MQYKRSSIQSWVKVEVRKVFYDFFLMSKSLKEKYSEEFQLGFWKVHLKNPYPMKHKWVPAITCLGILKGRASD